jgi:predicted N-acetyltransferase YhbS
MACDRGVVVTLGEPGADGLGDVVRVLRDWQRHEAPVQLHPGDLGWFWRFGAQRTAASTRTWAIDGRLVAVGLLDESTVVRLAVAPESQQDEELGRQLVGDLNDPARGVLTEAEASVEAPRGALVRDLLVEVGWLDDQPWTPLQRTLAEPVEDPGLRIEVTGPEQAPVRTAVQRAAFDSSTFTDERWHTMAAAPPYEDGRCLVGYDEQGEAVAATTVWSAGAGRPGLIEPLGVHREHRGQGHGRAITLAAAAALKAMGASTAVVCTPSSNVGGVAAYASAGFEQLPELADLRRPS